MSSKERKKFDNLNIMAAEYKNTNVNELAKQAEQDLNSHSAKHGHEVGDSTLESGIDTGNVEPHFAGASVKYGSSASGSGNNREIPPDEGGSLKPQNGQPTKAADFAHGGVGAPEARDQTFAATHGGDDGVRGNVRN
ncbi:Kynurenine formamidase [Pyrenophora seminiperda CCB06]|uniref:Kynurenine formamidase n=1 Tax=Pyrenophora seminiperda CCB06 TaxID=1302712 RepID=A0A3M7LZD7_9PLEO|nr:Kynurenine formamidase [Pyrenophora seminiperda CCB06]